MELNIQWKNLFLPAFLLFASFLYHPNVLSATKQEKALSSYGYILTLRELCGFYPNWFSKAEEDYFIKEINSNDTYSVYIGDIFIKLSNRFSSGEINCNSEKDKLSTKFTIIPFRRQ